MVTLIHLNATTGQEVVRPDSERAGAGESTANNEGDLPSDAIARLGDVRYWLPCSAEVVAWSSDGKKALVAGSGDTVATFTARTGSDVTSFKTRSPIDGVCWSPDNDSFAAAGGKSIYLIKPSTGRRRTIYTVPGATRALAMSEQYIFIVKKERDAAVAKTIVLRNDADSPDIISTIQESDVVSLHGATERIACAGDRSIRIFDAEGKVQQTIPTDQTLLHVKYSTTGKHLLGASKSAIHEWRVSDGKLIQTVELGEGTLLDVHAVKGEQGKSTLIYAMAKSDDKRDGMSIFDTSKDKAVPPIKWKSAGTVAVSPDGKVLLVAGDDHSNHPAMIDRASRKALNEPPYLGTASFQTSRRSELLCMSTGESILDIWSAASGKKLHRVELSGPSELAALSSDGKMLATLEKDHIVVRRLADSSIIARMPAPAEATWLQFSPRDSYVAVSGRFDKRYAVKLFEAATWRPYRTILTETYDAAKLDISPDERFMVTFCDRPSGLHDNQPNSGIARVWHIRSSRMVAAFDSGWDCISMAGFGCLGQRLVVASTNRSTPPFEFTASAWDLITKEKAWDSASPERDLPYCRRPVDRDDVIWLGTYRALKESNTASSYTLDIWAGVRHNMPDALRWYALFPRFGTGLCYDAYRPPVLNRLPLGFLAVAAEQQDSGDVDELWDDLGGASAKATPAFEKLANSKTLPTKTQFDRMLAKNFDQDKIAELFKELSSDKASVRDAAERQLKAYGPRAAVWIEHHIESTSEPLPKEVEVRVRSIVEAAPDICPDDADSRRLCRFAYLLSQSDQPLAYTYLKSAYERYKGTAVGYHFLTALRRFEERQSDRAAAD